MADLAVIRDPVSGVNFTAVPGRRAYLLTEDGSLSFSFEFAPAVIEYGGWEQEWVQVERVGLVPLLVRKADKLDTMQFTINLANRDWYFGDQTGHIDAIKRLAKTRLRVMMRYSDSEAGLWRITACSISSVHRDPVTSRIIRGSAELTLTRASEPAPSVGPVSSPANPMPQPAPAGNAPPRTHTVATGDTLWAIAARYYGQGERWPVIYDANRDKLTTPWLIRPGMVLTIP